MVSTIEQYNRAFSNCRDIFVKKTIDYGTSWRVLRPISIIDQIYIKAQRIRNIQETGVQKIDEDILSEYIGIINYSIIGLIQLHLLESDPEELEIKFVEDQYNTMFLAARTLMMDKNHDYGEAWRNMTQESFVDLILMKLQRMRQIVVNKGKTLISEGMDANYFDMINYAVFAIILLDEASNNNKK